MSVSLNVVLVLVLLALIGAGEIALFSLSNAELEKQLIGSKVGGLGFFGIFAMECTAKVLIYGYFVEGETPNV